jgi:hypothetical protein
MKPKRVRKNGQAWPNNIGPWLEQAAVEDGIAAYENLLSKLADVPTPAGPTPHQIGAELVQITSFRQVAMPVAQDGGAKVYR